MAAWRLAWFEKEPAFNPSAAATATICAGIRGAVELLVIAAEIARAMVAEGMSIRVAYLRTQINVG